MTVATWLTVARLVMAPLFVVFLLRQTVHSLWIASALFTLASLTDTFDGYLARRTGTVTKLGRMLDPLADKLLVAFAYISFVILGIPGVALWMVIIIIARELFVTWLRSFVGRRGVIIHSSPLGKWKTTFQMVYVFGVLALMSFRAASDPAPSYWQNPPSPWSTILPIALLLTTAITLLSGLDYVWKNRAALRSSHPGAA